MKHKYFANFLDDIQDVYDEHIKKYQEAFSDLERARKAKERVDSNPGDRFFGEKRHLAAKELVVAEREFKMAADKIQNEAMYAVDALKKALKNDVAEYAAADPGKLDANTVTLLNSGILGSRDLVGLANKNWGNPTMLRLIENYANRIAESDLSGHDRAVVNTLRQRINSHCGEKDRIDIMDAAGAWVRKCLQGNEYVAAAMQREAPNAFGHLRELMASTDTFSMEVE